MRKRLIAVAGVLAIAINFLTVSCNSKNDSNIVLEFYHEDVEVYEIDAENESVVFCDNAGELWDALFDDVNEFHVGDKYTLIFDDLGTSSVYDDEIVDVV